jgi:hypothetical protein
MYGMNNITHPKKRINMSQAVELNGFIVRYRETVVREAAIESLEQALCNLRSYSYESTMKHINDAISYLDMIDKLNLLNK